MPPIETVVTEAKPPAPIVPNVDQLKMREVDWIIVTPENMEQVFAEIKGEKALFALDVKGYENIALNLSDIRAILQQQQAVIAIYKKQFSQ